MEMYNSGMTGFIQDIIKVLEGIDILVTLQTICMINGRFPSWSRWKNIVNSAVYSKHHNDWVKLENSQEIVNQCFFLSCHPLNEISKWYELWNFSSLHSRQMTDVIQLPCGSIIQ